MATWAALRDTIEQMVTFTPGTGWHVPRGVADKALRHIARHEENKWPVPKLLPSNDEDLELIWRCDGWTIYECFSPDDETYFHVHHRAARSTTPGTGDGE